jgi:hypothetical protein
MAAAIRFSSTPFDGFNLSCVLIVPPHRRVAVEIHDGTPPKINADYHVYVAGKDSNWGNETWGNRKHEIDSG